MQATHQDIDLFGNWEGYTVVGVRVPQNPKRSIHITFVHAMGGGVDVANAAAPDASITTVPFESFVICRYSNTL